MNLFIFLNCGKMALTIYNYIIKQQQKSIDDQEILVFLEKY